MQVVEPQVYVVGEPMTNGFEVMQFLEEAGAPNWKSNPASQAEGLIEMMGRLCYRSFAPGLNKNVQRVREGNAAYLSNLVEQRHGSVLEHCTVNFVFANVSRVFTHELVRHRVGTAISQESLRFVRLDDIKMWLPPEIANDPYATKVFTEVVNTIQEAYEGLERYFGLDSTDMSFEEKKKITSALRRIAPEGMATVIGWSANFRTLRHVIEARTTPSAEREIRVVFGKVAEECVKRWPAVFADYEISVYDGLPCYTTKNQKV